MALLQISEPGQSPDPHQRRIAIGIDLGTTHSLVAAMRNGVAECLPDDLGRAILPSAVRYLGEGRRQIGFDALAEQANDPENTIVSVKRFMGRAVSDVQGRERLPYRFVDAPGMLQIETREGAKSPVEVSAEILATLASPGTLRAKGAILSTLPGLAALPVAAASPALLVMPGIVVAIAVGHDRLLL